MIPMMTINEGKINEINFSSKSGLCARFNFNDILFLTILMVLTFVLIFLFIAKQSIYGGVILSVVYVYFLIDFILHLNKKKYFLHYIRIKESGLYIKTSSWGKPFIDRYFDRNEIETEVRLEKERHNSILLVLILNETQIKIYEDSCWTEENLIHLIKLLMKGSYLHVDQKVIKHLIRIPHWDQEIKHQ